MNFVKLFGFSLAAPVVALSVVFLVAVSPAVATTLNEEAAKSTVVGFANRCDLHIFGGTPVLRVNVYETADEALQSKTSVRTPKGSFAVDGAAGFQIAQLFAESKVRAICDGLLKNDVPKLIEAKLNAQDLAESVTIDGQTIVSDAFYLKSDADRAMLSAVVRAYIDQTNKLLNAK